MNNKRTKIFFDTEFTGLHQKTTLISIGCISETGDTFYAISHVYDVSQVDKWIKEHVLENLDEERADFIGSPEEIGKELSKWLSKFGLVEMWSDCLAFDWVLFCQMFGHAFKVPQNIYYIPFDLSTFFLCHGIDPDIDREEFAELERKNKKHNALWDAKIIRICYEKTSLIYS